MQNFINYCEHLQSWQRALILALGLTFFWLLELMIPLVRLQYNKWQHASINLFFTGTTIAVNFGLAFLLVYCCTLCTTHRFGIWYWLAIPLWAKVIIALFVLDLVGAYLIHYLQHHNKWLWMFHAIHHTDVTVDTTTANRHHPGESMLRAIFTAGAILISGAPFGVVIIYQALSALLSQFNHANILLPKWLNVSIGWLVVTPSMHRVHHHYLLPLTNTNYGNIFSIRDKLLGTYASANVCDIQFGLDTHPLPSEHNSIKNLLHLPLQPYRPPTN